MVWYGMTRERERELMSLPERREDKGTFVWCRLVLRLVHEPAHESCLEVVIGGHNDQSESYLSNRGNVDICGQGRTDGFSLTVKSNNFFLRCRCW